MAVTEDRKPGIEKAQEPQTLNFIERISYFEHFTPIEADNDNATSPNKDRQLASACFDAWAIPEYMRN